MLTLIAAPSKLKLIRWISTRVLHQYVSFFVCNASRNLLFGVFWFIRILRIITTNLRKVSLKGVLLNVVLLAQAELGHSFVYVFYSRKQRRTPFEENVPPI